MRKQISFAAFIGVIVFGACTNSGSATGSATLNPVSRLFSFNVSLPSYPNKRFSAYVFSNNTLVAVVRSNAMTDGSGRLNVNALAVDSNNCATGTEATTFGGTYNVHVRIDSNGNSGTLYPSGCPSDYGFLSTAGQGYVGTSTSTTYPVWPYYVYYVSTTYQGTFSFSNTGLGTVSRQVYCNVVDGQILNPTIYTSSTLGFAQGAVAFTAGSGNATTTMTFPYGGVTYKYACWIDANNSGTYNSGDLIANGPGYAAAISSWSTVP